ncbi:hypothetical protein II906_03045 [bacterium]|nr:hypothetical protein [bacterium]
MRISQVCTPYISYNKNIKHNKCSKPVNDTKKDVSFKGVYVDTITNLGHTKAGIFPAKFAKKDSLLINEIASLYPNQDCFIKCGVGGFPYLEYRERPPEVENFNDSIYGQYTTSLNPYDKNYPSEILILYPREKEYMDKHPEMTMMIGVPSYISINPSLAYTIKAGYEVHKKLLEKKYQILDAFGENEDIDFGGKTVTEKAHEAIQDVETAVTRYLLECSFAALTDRADASQIYASNYPKIQSRFDAKRRLDLTTSLAKQTQMKNSSEIESICKMAIEMLKKDKDNNSPHNENEDIEQLVYNIISRYKLEKSGIDICEFAMQNYPNFLENKQRIDELMFYMTQNGITLFNSADLSLK